MNKSTIFECGQNLKISDQVLDFPYSVPMRVENNSGRLCEKRRALRMPVRIVKAHVSLRTSESTNSNGERVHVFFIMPLFSVGVDPLSEELRLP